MKKKGAKKAAPKGKKPGLKATTEEARKAPARMHM